MGTGTDWKLCTNSFCEGAPVALGTLPAKWEVGAWHRLALMAVNETVTASMDGVVFYHGAAAVTPPLAPLLAPLHAPLFASSSSSSSSNSSSSDTTSTRTRTGFPQTQTQTQRER